jgi:Ammonium Transporter Family
MINGMIAGLVAITPGAGWMSGYSALILGVLAGTVPYFTMNVLGNRGIFKKVDDTLGVIHTHGFPGALGGLFIGVAASPNMIQYLGTKGNPDVSFAGWIHGNPHQFVVQAFALGVIVVFNVVATFVILKVISFITPLRMSQAELEGADVAVHGEYVIDLEGLELPEAVPALAGVGADGDGRGGPIAAQLRATLGDALGVHPDGLALLSGEQAAAALAKHAALEARLRSQANPSDSTGAIPGKPANRATKVRPSSEDAE